MAANRNSRYYSQSYEAVDNPANPAHLGQPETSHQPDGDYQDYETYRGFKTVSDLDIAEPSPGLPPRQSHPKNRRKLYIIVGSVALVCVIIGLAVGLGVGLTHKDTAYKYVPAKGDAYVTDSRSFGKGATHESSSNVTDGIGAGKDEYTYYSGPAKEFPPFSDWISFEDMWKNNLQFFKTSCHANKFGKDQT
jgi:hypothetical protein